MDSHTKITSEEANKTVFKWIAPIINPEITNEKLVDAYKTWTENSDYEKDLVEGGGYQAHILTVQYFTDGYPEEKRADAKIFDAGAGTGMVARGLRANGFVHIDALDPSKEMLDVAKKEGLYENYFVDFLNEKQLPIPPDTYDGVTAAGCFSPGHVPCSALHELIRIVKPGGMIVIVTRIDYLDSCPEYKDRLEPLMEKLEKEGKWKKLKRDVGARFYLDKEAVCYKYEVLAKSS